MTAYIVKTKTSEYMVDVEGRFWMRNDDGLERIWIFKSAVKPTTLPWDRNETAEAEWVDTEVPKVGTRMYLSSKDTWAISSEVVSVDEKP